MDGIPLAKAEEMTIYKTIELCRENAQNNVFKSVLASSKINYPKEVIGEYVIESSTSKQEAQIFLLKKFQNRDTNGQNGNWRYNKTR